MVEFNLAEEKWIPCIKLIGGAEKFNLEEILLRATEIQEIYDQSPLVNVALHRLLLAILHRIFGMVNSTEWGRLWNGGKDGWDEKAISAYFQEWATEKNRFDLFDKEHPFYQCASLPLSAKRSNGEIVRYDGPISIIFHELATGNNAILFDHTIDNVAEAVKVDEAARRLVAFQAFAVGGLLTCEVNQRKDEYGTAKNAPLVKGAVNVVQGENLFQTLMLNFIGASMPWVFDSNNAGIPAWELDKDTTVTMREPDSYLDLLTWQSRRVRLIPELMDDGQVVIKRVVRMKGNEFTKGSVLKGREPMLIFKKIAKPKQGGAPWVPLAFTEDRALWRDSLLLLRSAGEVNSRPMTLDWLYDLVADDIIPYKTHYQMAAYGLSSNKAKIDFWRHERLPLPLVYLADYNLYDELSRGLEIAEEVGALFGYRRLAVSGVVNGKETRILVSSPFQVIATWLLLLNSNEKPDPDTVENFVRGLAPDRLYWAKLESQFHRFMESLPEDKTVDKFGVTRYGDSKAKTEWTKSVCLAARESFDEATSSLDRTGRTLKAIAKGEKTFNLRLQKIKNKYIVKEEVSNEQTTGI